LTATHHGIDIQGTATDSLADRLGDKAEAFFGMAVADFPNLFVINGPNTGLGHNSMIYMAECGGKKRLCHSL
jgi:cation diffusion facilitator CzcD-associated flavoprotein CzcO